jgi:hypothetical protein
MPRKAGYRHHEDTRRKIQAAQIINRLEAHVFGEKPILDPSQVNAAKVLLAKVLPDLKAHEHSGEMKVAIATKEQRDAAVAAAVRADR